MADVNAILVRIPASALVDGAVVELGHDAEGVLTADVRIPAPAPEPAAEPATGA